VKVFEMERIGKKIDNYIEHVIICYGKNDFEVMKKESISLLFFASQMMGADNTIRRKEDILEIAENLINQIN